MAEQCAYERAADNLAAVVKERGFADDAPMRLVDCRMHGGRPPRDAIYIGRKMPGLKGSPLRNPYVAKSRARRGDHQWALILPDAEILERYKRHLTRRVVDCAEVFEALRGLPPGATLACWCVEREAARVGVGGNEVEICCHGDVVFTLWRALHELDWELPWVTRGPAAIGGEWVEDARELTPQAAVDRTWARVYELAFGEPMRWGTREHAWKPRREA